MKKADQYSKKGDSYYRDGDLTRAIEFYKKAAAEEPRKATHHYALGLASFRARDNQLALGSFTRAVKLAKGFLDGRYYLARSLERSGEHDKALKEYKKIEKEGKADGRVLVRLSVLNLREGKSEKALDYIKKAKKKGIKRTILYLTAGICHTISGNNREALRNLTKALELSPQVAYGWYFKGLVLYGMGRYEEAMECYDRMLKLDPDNVDGMYAKAWALTEQKKYPLSLKLLDKIIELDPKDIGTYIARGNIHVYLEDKDSAADDYLTVIGLDQDMSLSYENLGRLFHMNNESDVALAYFREAYRRDPDEEVKEIIAGLEEEVKEKEKTEKPKF